MAKRAAARCAPSAAPCLPPGLEGPTRPLEATVGETFKNIVSSVGGHSIGIAGSTYYGPELATQGEWVNAVTATAPYLDAEGLQQALGILDCAIHNVLQAKALDTAISEVYNAGGGFGADGTWAMCTPELMTAELMRNQIYEQQHMLLLQLHCLRAGAQECGLAAEPAMALANAELETGNERLVSGEKRATAAKEAGSSSDSAVAERVLRALEPSQKTNTGGGSSGPTGKATRPAIGATPAVATAAGATARHNKAGVGAPHSSTRPVQTLSTSLQLLADEDPDCLFIVRRISKLGFKACRKLKQHFSAYGTVVRVLVAHSTVRQHGDPQCNSRRRPSSLGFVHMASAGAVSKVLAEGDEQEIDGCLIRVQCFRRQLGDGADEEGDGEGEAAAAVVSEAWEVRRDSSEQAVPRGKDGPWCRQQSAFSTTSTRTAASTATSLESDLEGAEPEPN